MGAAPGSGPEPGEADEPGGGGLGFVSVDIAPEAASPAALAADATEREANEVADVGKPAGDAPAMSDACDVSALGVAGTDGSCESSDDGEAVGSADAIDATDGGEADGSEESDDSGEADSAPGSPVGIELELDSLAGTPVGSEPGSADAADPNGAPTDGMPGAVADAAPAAKPPAIRSGSMTG